MKTRLFFETFDIPITFILGSNSLVVTAILGIPSLLARKELQSRTAALLVLWVMCELFAGRIVAMNFLRTITSSRKK